MILNDLLEAKNMTKYRLSKLSGVPFTNISEITTGKSDIKKCTGETLFKLARTLDVTIEDLLAESMEKRPSFEWFKSEVCHEVKRSGDLDFIIKTLQSGEIRRLYEKKWYPECLYLLAMIDYLSRDNGLPICSDYSDIRRTKLNEPIYPVGVIMRSAYANSEVPMNESVSEAIPEFMRHNIIESEIRNVY
jgi:transcriptional regulator with XRE-family HTH domain